MPESTARPFPSASDLALAATCEYAVLRAADALHGWGPGPVVDATTASCDVQLVTAVDGGPADVVGAARGRSATPRDVFLLAAHAALTAEDGAVLSGRGRLRLRDGGEVEVDLREVADVVADRRARLDAALALHAADGRAVRWGDPRFTACGRCATCDAAIIEHRDVMLVAGLRPNHRDLLARVGVHTIDDLVAYRGPAGGDAWPLPTSKLAALQDQARAQVRQLGPVGAAPGPVTFRLVDPAPLRALPEVQSNDLFVTFERAPGAQSGPDDLRGRWVDSTATADDAADILGTEGWRVSLLSLRWNITADERVDFAAQPESSKVTFRSLVRHLKSWADDGGRIYHYGPDLPVALRRLAVEARAGESLLVRLDSRGAFIDLRQVVRRALRVSERSYDLPALAPLFAADDADTVRAIRDGDPAPLLRMRQWLDRFDPIDASDPMRSPASRPAPAATDLPTVVRPPSAKEADATAGLEPWAEPAPGAPRTPAQQATAMVAAAIGYHRREAAPDWAKHQQRLGAALCDIEDRGAMVLESVQVIERWARVPAPYWKSWTQTLVGRRLLLRGRLAPGHEFTREAYLLYDVPAPPCLPTGTAPHARAYSHASIEDIRRGDDWDEVEVIETVPHTSRGEDPTASPTPWDDLPTVVTVNPFVPGKTITEALIDHARELRDRMRDSESDDAALRDPAGDVLARRPPCLLGDRPLAPVIGDDYVTPIVDAVSRLDRSYLAVQGPPGTGKTYVGARVAAAMVARGWKVGVVAQSHAAVEHMLERIMDAGVPAAQVGKVAPPDAPEPRWTPLAALRSREPGARMDWAAFLSRAPASGRVVGGTTWDFTNRRRVGVDALDLILIEEAGQFSLAHTIAVATSTRRLLLLGDPQQLPQVSCGDHPEPVDVSALAWLRGDAAGGATLPAEFGYFLDTTRRMHPALCEAVSQHSYGGRLRSHARVTAARRMVDAAGAPVEPGVFMDLVPHRHRNASSPEEVEHVVGLVRQALTWRWHDPARSAGPRPMTQEDILVVAPYNAQRQLLRDALDQLGLVDVRVGTVDKFQGREAPLTIVSMTTSAPQDAPRGLGFLMSPNRINVAVSRAQWRSVVVCSPHLTDQLPPTAEELANLGAFLSLGRRRPAGGPGRG